MDDAKNKVVLLALNAKFSHTNLAIRYLRASFCQQGMEKPELLEMTINNYIPEILGRIYEMQPKILGIACYIWNIEMVKSLLPLIRKVLPDTVIICGGPEVSYETEAFLRQYSVVNYVVRGEGEGAFVNLVKYISSNGMVHDIGLLAGIAYIDSKGEFLDGGCDTVYALDEKSLPFAYEADEMAELKERILYYETSRGCPFSCAYCLSCATAGVRYRPWNLVEKELQFFVQHDVRQVKFVDRTFNAMKKHFWPILEFIKALPDECQTNFHFEIAVDYLDEETINLLQELPHNRVQLEIGIQTTNQDVLESIQRRNDWSKISSNICALLKNHNMHIHTDLIIGLPGEDMQSFAKSFNMVYGLDTDMLQLGFLKFLKGSAMMELVEKYDYKYMDIGPYEVLSSNTMTYEEIHWLHIFEEVFELYHNAGRCRNTSNACIIIFEAGNAFSFYRKFTDFWQEKNYHHQPHAAKYLYRIMKEFLSQQYENVDFELLDNMLKYDALLADGGKIRPMDLNWNLEKYQDVTAEFWRNRGNCKVEDYLPDFQFSTWREIRNKYHIEKFEYPVNNIVKKLQANQPIETNVTWILFDYTAGSMIKQFVFKST